MSADRATAPRMPRGLRLFIALWPTPAVRRALCVRRDAIRWPPHARIVPDQRLHLTLHFIGPVPSALWPRLLPALREVRCSSVELELGAAQQWPHGLVVLPATAVPPPLRALHTALAGALTGLGLPVERRSLRPHVTLRAGCRRRGIAHRRCAAALARARLRVGELRSGGRLSRAGALRRARRHAGASAANCHSAKPPAPAPTPR